MTNFALVMEYQCPICEKMHTELPHIGSAAPFQWTDSLFKNSESLLTKDLCVIKGEHFFVRGVIEIPVHEYEFEFGWGVWVSHKKENFETYRDNFESGDIGPFFGWLCTKIDYFQDSTMQLKTTANYRGEGQRPRVVLWEANHPLYLQQRDGLSIDDAWKIVHHYMPK